MGVVPRSRIVSHLPRHLRVVLVLEAVQLGQHGLMQHADDQNAAVVLSPEEHRMRLVRPTKVRATMGGG